MNTRDQEAAPLFSTQRATMMVALVSALALGLGGCALVDTGSGEPPTALEICAQGKTWRLDMSVLGTQLTGDLNKRGVQVTTSVAEGSQTMKWDTDGKVVLTSDYTMTVTTALAPDQTLIMKDKHSGTSTGIAYINAEVAIPRNWDATGLTIKPTATLNGADVDPATYYTFPPTDIDDSVGVELTCDGTTLTTHQRESDMTMTWKAG